MQQVKYLLLLAIVFLLPELSAGFVKGLAWTDHHRQRLRLIPFATKARLVALIEGWLAEQDTTICAHVAGRRKSLCLLTMQGRYLIIQIDTAQS